jgi:predicted RNase H-like nuclease
MAFTSPARTPRPTATRPWSLRDRLTERDITELITAYRDGATAASLAADYALSLKSVKRLLHTAGVRRTPSLDELRRQRRSRRIHSHPCPAFTTHTAA